MADPDGCVGRGEVNTALELCICTGSKCTPYWIRLNLEFIYILGCFGSFLDPPQPSSITINNMIGTFIIFFVFPFPPQELASDVEADCQLFGGKSQALQEEASLMHHIMSRLRRYQDERLETSGLKWKLPPGGQPICLFSASSNPSKNNSRPIIRPNDDSECAAIVRPNLGGGGA